MCYLQITRIKANKCLYLFIYFFFLKFFTAVCQLLIVQDYSDYFSFSAYSCACLPLYSLVLESLYFASPTFVTRPFKSSRVCFFFSLTRPFFPFFFKVTCIKNAYVSQILLPRGNCTFLGHYIE